ncbi:Murein hydrolase activator EnvC [Sodalis praecaptivus]
MLGQLKQQEQSIARSSRALRDTQRTLETLNRDIDRLTRSIRQLQDRQAAQRNCWRSSWTPLFARGSISGYS